MKKLFSKTIGVVGGAGPVASAFLYSSILRTCQKVYHANDYNEFPEIILISYPFTRGDKEAIQQELASCFSRLTNAGAELLCIASHSFHGLLPKGQIPRTFFNNRLVQKSDDCPQAIFNSGCSHFYDSKSLGGFCGRRPGVLAIKEQLRLCLF